MARHECSACSGKGYTAGGICLGCAGSGERHVNAVCEGCRRLVRVPLSLERACAPGVRCDDCERTAIEATDREAALAVGG